MNKETLEKIKSGELCILKITHTEVLQGKFSLMIVGPERLEEFTNSQQLSLTELFNISDKEVEENSIAARHIKNTIKTLRELSHG